MNRGFRRNPAGAGQAPVTPIDVNDVFDAAVRLEQREDLPAAEEAFGAADRLGHAAAAVKLGVLLEERDDLAGAEQAFRRADDRGDATGAFHLAWLLQERGDLAGAEEAYRRAELLGHPAAEANLRVLLARRAPHPAPSAVEPTLAASVATAATAAPAADEAGGAGVEPETAIHSVPSTAAGAGAATAGGGGAASAPTAARQPRGKGGVLRRTVSVVLPVAAFAIAFLVGEATKRPAPSQSHVAPTTNVSDSTVTLSTVAPVPRPAKLVVKPKPSKPPASSATVGTITFHRAIPAAPVYRVSVPRSSPPVLATQPASGTATSPSSRTTTANMPGSTTPGSTTLSSTTPSGTPSGGRTVDGTNAGATSVSSAGSTTTSSSTTAPGG
ncbi:MAG TPA: hypothetical protein VG371_10835 [Solirubrobacteraceae bacterium]|nr:hypothetical protein [Solirubrobacteraceae bacterium]